MTTKLKIDLAEGVLEVEGSESFVKAIYNDFKAHFIGEDAVDEDQLKPKRSRRGRKTTKSTRSSKAKTKTKPSPAQEQEPAPEPAAEPAEPPPAETEETKAPAKPDYSFLKDLDLTAADGRPSLVEFMDSKFPITNEERNLVFLHYLQHILKLKKITTDHIYTCYKAAKIRIPLNLESSLQTTVDQRRWIKIAKNGTLSVTPAGKLYVEKQLPKKIKS